MDRTGYEKPDSNVKRCCCEDSTCMCYTILQVQKSCNKKVSFFTLKVAETVYTCIMSFAKASQRNFSVEIHLYNDKRNSPQSGHSGGNAYFFTKHQLGYFNVSGTFQAVCVRKILRNRFSIHAFTNSILKASLIIIQESQKLTLPLNGF